MAESKDEPIVDVQEAFSKTERYIDDNKKSLGVILGLILVLVAVFFGYKKFISEPKDQEAQAVLFYAERYFDMDSTDKAMNGDGEHPGLIEIVEDYGSTPTGNTAKYMLGICYFQKGQYEESIEMLEDFDSKSMMLAPIANAIIGDAHMELGEKEDAIEYYLKAANMNRNDFSTPINLMKAGMAYIDLGKFKEAVGVFEQIRTEFPDSREGREIEKHLEFARLKAGLTE